MRELPPNKKFHQKEAYYSMVLAPLEYITKSLRMGDGWHLADLTPLAQRCRALADAYDKRMEAHENDRS